MVVLVSLVAVVFIAVLVLAISTAISAHKLKKQLDKVFEEIPKRSKEGPWLTGYDFCDLFKEIFMHEDQWIIETGNWENANLAVLQAFAEKVQRHPFIFALLFHF